MGIVAGHGIEVTKLHDDRSVVSALVPKIQPDSSVVWDADSISPSIGNGSVSSYYIKHGNLVTVSFELTIGTTTTAGTGLYSVSLPFANTGSIGFVGSAYFQDSSTSKNYDGSCVVAAGQAAVSCYIGDATWSSTAPTVPATGDVIGFTITYLWT